MFPFSLYVCPKCGAVLSHKPADGQHMLTDGLGNVYTCYGCFSECEDKPKPTEETKVETWRDRPALL